MTEYELTKRGNLHIKKYMQTGHQVKIPMEGNTYYINVETTDKEFFDYIDKELDKLIKKYKDQ